MVSFSIKGSVLPMSYAAPFSLVCLLLEDFKVFNFSFNFRIENLSRWTYPLTELPNDWVRHLDHQVRTHQTETEVARGVVQKAAVVNR